MMASVASHMHRGNHQSRGPDSGQSASQGSSVLVASAKSFIGRRSNTSGHNSCLVEGGKWAFTCISLVAYHGHRQKIIQGRAYKSST
ncbi:hypothetical protein XELAEV_18045192mg [Xenopus laevis]|uniref:Uncharacterized protein n=1 Tax=Xenopus laevis TaxID=8355 RepID=A0A974C092_XENLA|nr:hypothetical protein XELAEV_18045192mg [Xenopus laevis]